MSFSEIRKFLIKMQSDEELKKEVTTSSTADDVALIGQRLGYDFSGDDLLRFNGQKVDKVTVRKVDHPGEYHLIKTYPILQGLRPCLEHITNYL